MTAADLLDQGPAVAPRIAPHRGERPHPPRWLQRFVAWGPLSYVRLGREIVRFPDLLVILPRLTRWLAPDLWASTPLWHPPQLRYRLRAWWAYSS